MKRAIAVVAALLILAGCSSSAGKPTKGSASPGKHAVGAVVVYAAASLTEAFDTLKTQFENAHPGSTITLKFGASSDLAAQLAQGAPADVFASASPKNMDSVVSAGVAANPVTFTSNTAEIAVPPSNPGKVRSIRDLAGKGVKVATCAPAVPCGALAAKVFQNARLAVKPVASAKDVKSTLAVVESGDVDAGVVYVTDVRAAGNKVKGIRIPASVNARTNYEIAAVKQAKSPTLAKDWVNFVNSPAGKKVLVADGFTAP